MNLLRKIASWVATNYADFVERYFDVRDFFWMTGLAAVGFGVSQIYIPAAWIVCGCAVFWMGVKR